MNAAEILKKPPGQWTEAERAALKALTANPHGLQREAEPRTLRFSLPAVESEERRQRREAEDLADAEFRRRQAEFAREAKTASILAAAGLPELHARRAGVSEGGPWSEALAQTLTKLETGGIVALLGPRGTGKTQIAVEAVRHFARYGSPGKYRKATDLFREFRSCFKEGGPDESALFNGYVELGCLVIDEAHRRGHSPWENVTLTDLIDHRYDARKPTLLISNETRADFGEAIGPSVVSRMHEVGLVIECKWPSFREARA